MLDKKKREYLQNVYFTPKSPGSFGSVQKVWKHIREDGVVSLNELKQWLLEQDEFTSYRSYKQKFRRPRVVVPYVDAVWGTDVAHMTQFAKDNDKLEIKVGVLNGKVLDFQAIKALASLPSREVLLAQFLSALNAVPTSFVRAVGEIPRSLVNVLTAIKDQKEAA